MRILLSTKSFFYRVFKISTVFVGLSLAFTVFAQVQETESIDAGACRLLGNIEGNSGFGKKFEWKSHAKFNALSRAEQIGANQIVWEKFYPVGAFNGVAVAKAYKCS